MVACGRRLPVTWITPWWLAGAGRHAVLLRLLFEGLDHLAAAAAARSGRPARRSRTGPFCRCAGHGVLLLPDVLTRVSRQAALGAPHDAHAHGPHDDEDEHHGERTKSPSVVTVPLVLLAIPSVIIGFVTIDALLFGASSPPHRGRRRTSSGDEGSGSAFPWRHSDGAARADDWRHSGLSSRCGPGSVLYLSGRISGGAGAPLRPHSIGCSTTSTPGPHQ